MAEKLPIVYVDGALSQLPDGDSIDASDLGSVVAVSGLVGGGDLNTGDKRVDVALATNPSGIIFVGDTVGYDGVALADADLALASGSQALADANSALSVNIAVEELAETTLEFNNAVLESAVNFAGSSSVRLVAGAPVTEGTPCGLNSAGEVETIRLVPQPGVVGLNNLALLSHAEQAGQTLASVLNPNSSRVYTVYHKVPQTGPLAGIFVTFMSVYEVSVQGDSTSYVLIDTEIVVATNSKLLPNQSIVFCPDKNGGIVFTASTSTGYLQGTPFYDDNSSSSPMSFNTTQVIESNNVLSYYSPIASCWCGEDGKVFLCFNSNPETVMKKIALNTNSVTPGTINIGINSTYGSYLIAATSCSYNFETNQVVLTICDANSGTGVNYVSVVDVLGNLATPPSVLYTNNVLGAVDTQTIQVCETPFPTPGVGGCCLTYRGTAQNGPNTLGDYIVLPPASGVALQQSTQTILENDCNGPSVSISDFENDNIFLFYSSFQNKPAFNIYERSGPNFGNAWIVKQATTYIDGVTAPQYLSLCYAASGVTDQYALSLAASNQVTGGIDFLSTTTTVAETVVPTFFGTNNFIGIASATAPSGSVVSIDTPCSVNVNQENLTTGLFYYLDIATSGITTISGNAQGWVNNNPPPTLPLTWQPVGKAVSSSGIIVLNTF